MNGLSNKLYIGIDNGVSGALGFVYPDGADLRRTPTISEIDYNQKKGKHITRLDFLNFKKLMEDKTCWSPQGSPAASPYNPVVVMEYPFKNPMGIDATVSGFRCFEAQLIVLELLEIPRHFITSQTWQKVLLPEMSKTLKGPARKRALKAASADVGCRLFPHLADAIKKQKDADALLIAEWARRQGL
jgi:hypothetical protein